MKKTVAGITLFALGFLPLAASALSIGDLQAQVQTLLSQISSLQSQQGSQSGVSGTSVTIAPSVQPRMCITLYRNLSQGTRGDDVSSLQEFLNSQGYLSAAPSGYYGPLTRSAVVRWQTSEGIAAVGAFGPMSRERARVRCGALLPTPAPTCKPINFMPVLCSDGSTPQPVQDQNGCTVSYECPAANFTPPQNCKAWYDGCNNCSRQYLGGPAMCTLRACFTAGKGYCTAYFDETSSNRPPIISGFSGPTTLSVNQTGTWSIQASDPENGSLSYSITWGDETALAAPMASYAARDVFVQTTTFTHAYNAAGTYTITAVVRDASGLEARTTTTVRVGESPTYCTMEYAPVCGEPPEPACRHSVPPCMMPTPGPRTYGNRCVMNAEGATFLYDGLCAATAY